MHSINILPNKPVIVPDDSYINNLNTLKSVLSKFELTRWQNPKFLSLQITYSESFWTYFDFSHFRIMLVQLKSNPWLRVPIATLQFLWVALNNITGVFGYLCLYVCALPIRMFDKQLFDAIERNLYHITFYFCSSWGFENGWKMIVSGDVSSKTFFSLKILTKIEEFF